MQSDTGSEFKFLDRFDPDLRTLLEGVIGNVGKPRYAMVDARAFIERLLAQIALCNNEPKQGFAGSPNERLEEFINRLRDAGIIPKPQADHFHRIRQLANPIIHGERAGTASQVIEVASLAKGLALWFERSQRSEPSAAQEARAPTYEILSGVASEFESQSPNDRPQSPPQTDHHPPRPQKSARQSMDTIVFIVIAVVIAGMLLGILRQSGSVQPSAAPAITETSSAPTAATSPAVTPFPGPQQFVVTPGNGLDDVNERNGPGAAYAVVQKLSRGTQVTGIGRSIDADGNGWIQLSDGAGFVKETLLGAVGNQLPSSDNPATAQTPPPQQVQVQPSLPTPSPGPWKREDCEMRDGNLQCRWCPDPNYPNPIAAGCYFRPAGGDMNAEASAGFAPSNLSPSQPSGSALPSVTPGPWTRSDCEMQDGSMKCRWCPNPKYASSIARPCYMRPADDDMNVSVGDAVP